MGNEECVFLVDDDASARKGLARLLLTAGHRVQAFPTVREFLEVIRSGATGCAVLAAEVPDLSCVDLRDELKVRCERVSIIVISAAGDPQASRVALELKAAELFLKPVDGAALLDAVRWALRSRDSASNHTAT
jgi:FixJ family two-component response regulator